MTGNEDWAHRIIIRFDPKFRHRWVVYREVLEGLLAKGMIWFDIGCGDAGIVDQLKGQAFIAVGADLLVPRHIPDVPFVCCDLRFPPFRSGAADLVSLRFVVEHIQTSGDLKEIVRILKPGGRLLVLTTNTASPFIFIPRLLPFRIKHRILTSLFNVGGEDVFPTHHRFNSPEVMATDIPELELESFRYLQDANYTRRWIFVILFGWHLLTSPSWLQRFRTNILAVFVKRSPDLAVSPLHTSPTPQPPKH